MELSSKGSNELSDHFLDGRPYPGPKKVPARYRTRSQKALVDCTRQAMFGWL